jgi:uncharacterized protein
MNMRRFILILFLVVLAKPISAAKYPRPTGYVNDFAGVISSQYANDMTRIIAELKEKTGAEIAVVTVNTTAPEDITTYSVELYEEWGIGERGKDNGVLILAAINDRKAWITTGYGIEPIIPDGLAGEIYRDVMRPNFRVGDYGKGMLLAVQEMSARIANSYGVELSEQVSIPQRTTRRSRAVPCGGIIGFIILFIIFSLIFRLGPLGLLFFAPMLMGGRRGYWSGSSGFGGFTGGFGGFGGGSTGGGGAGGSW